MAKRIKEKNRNIAILSFRRWHCAEIQPQNGNRIINFLHELLQYSLPRISFKSLQIVIHLHAAQVRRHCYPHFVCWGRKHLNESSSLGYLRYPYGVSYFLAPAYSLGLKTAMLVLLYSVAWRQ